MANKPHGAAHFMQERISSAALGILAPIFAVMLVLGNDGSLDVLRAWISQPVNAWVTAAFLLVSLWHMMMGMDVIIDDYIHKPGTVGLLKAVNCLVCFAAAAGGVFAIYTMMSGGGLSS